MKKCLIVIIILVLFIYGCEENIFKTGQAIGDGSPGPSEEPTQEPTQTALLDSTVPPDDLPVSGPTQFETPTQTPTSAPSETPSKEPILCGNGNIDPGEDCDGENLDDKECVDIEGFRNGVLKCNMDANNPNLRRCEFDKSDCYTCFLYVVQKSDDGSRGLIYGIQQRFADLGNVDIINRNGDVNPRWVNIGETVDVCYKRDQSEDEGSCGDYGMKDCDFDRDGSIKAVASSDERECCDQDHYCAYHKEEGDREGKLICKEKEGTCCRCFWKETKDPDFPRKLDQVSGWAKNFCERWKIQINEGCDDIEIIKYKDTVEKDQLVAEKGCGRQFAKHTDLFLGHGDKDDLIPIVRICQRAGCSIDIEDRGCSVGGDLLCCTPCKNMGLCFDYLESLKGMGYNITIEVNLVDSPDVKEIRADIRIEINGDCITVENIGVKSCEYVESRACLVGREITEICDTGEVDSNGYPLFQYRRCCCSGTYHEDDYGWIEGTYGGNGSSTDVFVPKAGRWKQVFSSTEGCPSKCESDKVDSDNRQFTLFESDTNCLKLHDSCQDKNWLIEYSCEGGKMFKGYTDCREEGQQCMLTDDDNGVQAQRCDDPITTQTLNADIQNGLSDGSIDLPTTERWLAY